MLIKHESYSLMRILLVQCWTLDKTVFIKGYQVRNQLVWLRWERPKNLLMLKYVSTCNLALDWYPLFVILLHVGNDGKGKKSAMKIGIAKELSEQLLKLLLKHHTELLHLLLTIFTKAHYLLTLISFSKCFCFLGKAYKSKEISSTVLLYKKE